MGGEVERGAMEELAVGFGATQPAKTPSLNRGLALAAGQFIPWHARPFTGGADYCVERVLIPTACLGFFEIGGARPVSLNAFPDS